MNLPCARRHFVSFMTAPGHLEHLLLCPQASIFKGLYLWKAVAQSKLLEAGDWCSQRGESQLTLSLGSTTSELSITPWFSSVAFFPALDSHQKILSVLLCWWYTFCLDRIAEDLFLCHFNVIFFWSKKDKARHLEPDVESAIQNWVMHHLHCIVCSD